MAAGYARVGVTPGCHLNGRRQRHGRVRPQRNSAGAVAEEHLDVRHRRRCRHVNVHGAGSVHHRVRAVPGHRGNDRRQRARLHRRVPGQEAQAPVQLSARVAGRVRPVRGHTRHAYGPALPGPGQMAVRHVLVRLMGA